MANSTKKKFTPVAGSFFEQMKELSGSARQTAKKDLVGKMTETALQQVFGLPKTGELKQGQVLELNKEKKKKEPQLPFFEVQKKESLLFISEQEITQEVEAARVELKKAAQELKRLGKDVSEIEKAVEKMPTKPGIYHITFFERLRQVIKFFRERIEESRTWLKLMSSKKKQKGYWSRYKKQGTKFGLSSERAVATQAG